MAIELFLNSINQPERENLDRCKDWKLESQSGELLLWHYMSISKCLSSLLCCWKLKSLCFISGRVPTWPSRISCWSRIPDAYLLGSRCSLPWESECPEGLAHSSTISTLPVDIAGWHGQQWLNSNMRKAVSLQGSACHFHLVFPSELQNWINDVNKTTSVCIIVITDN